jgi:hypothetical protein
MAFASILSDIGKSLKKVFTVGTQVAQAAEPFVDIVYPGIGPLFNSVVAEAVKAEGLAIAAGQQNGTGPQKLASVVSSVTSEFNTFAQANNLAPMTTPQIEAAVSAIVTFLNSIPAAPAGASAAAPSVKAGDPVPEPTAVS